MNVTVFQARPVTPDLRYEELLDRWQPLRELPEVDEVTIYDKPVQNSAQLLERAPNSEAVLGVRLSSETINEELFRANPRLKYIAGFAHGFGEFDAEMTRRYGVTITNTVYGARTIAEHAFALLMEICHSVKIHNDYIKQRQWSEQDDFRSFCHLLSPQIELYSKTFGVLGLGNIGLNTARIAHGFGMEVIAYNRSPKSGPEYDFIEQVPLEELYRRSNVLSLSVPLTSQTRGLLDRDAFARMKDGVILINTARGGLIVEDDLVEALQSGKVYAAGLDVLSQEPPREHLPIMDCPNAVITGHIAYLPKSARLRQVTLAVDNFSSWLQGNPVSVINL